MNNNQDLKLTELIELANYFFSSISDDNTPDNPGSMLKIESDCDMYNSNDETIKNTNENRRDDNMKKDFDYGKLYGKFMACKCGQKDDDDNVSIYGCKCDNDCKCDDKCDCSWSDKCQCGDDCKCGNDWSYLWDDDNCKCGDDCNCGDNNKCDDECKSLWSRKSFKCSSDVF
ncbi:MAG: hypothetical protein Q4F66_14115, partial [Clostridium sp.]|nr:hypothetical protein [Clostridium sp.]